MQARGVAARPTPERTAQAFIRCNGLLSGSLGLQRWILDLEPWE